MLSTINNLLVLAVEEGAGGAEAEPSGVDLVLPETAELVWGAICFFVVLIVLSKVAFPKIRQAVEEREKKIQESLEAADRAKQEAAKEKEDYQRQIADARGEANRIVEEGRQQAEQVRKDLIAKAEEEARQIVQRAQEQLDAERNRAMGELQSTIRDLSIQLAEKVVGRSLDGQAHKELVDSYIREVGAMSGNGGRTA